MKHRPEDFKDILAGKGDRVAKVNEIKTLMKGYKDSFKFTVARRKLADGEKFYFTADSMGLDGPHVMKGRNLRNFVLNTVHIYFPDASVTSGGGSSVTISEY